MSDPQWYVMKLDTVGRRVYALGGGLYGNQCAALRYDAAGALDEVRKLAAETPRLDYYGIVAAEVMR